MEAMRQSWSDDRLDDLNHRVDEGFARVDERFAQMEARMDAQADRLDAKFDASRHGTSACRCRRTPHQLNSRFDAMQQTMMRVGAGLIGVLIASAPALSRPSC